MSVLPSQAACFQEGLEDKLRGLRVPFSGTFELTLGCNFRCPHCYLQGLVPAGAELGLGRIQSLLDEMAEAGCLGLTLTGGEPLLREDFAPIWRAAHRRGFVLSLFTNGSLVSEAIADLLAGHPPRLVEVSLYGAGPHSYARLTGRAEHFQASLDGLDRLLARGLSVVLKAVLLSPLAHEADGLLALAARRGLGIRFDPAVDPRLDGDPTPIGLRMDARQAVALELGDSGLRAERALRLEDWVAQDFACGAGRRAFHLDPAGDLMACMLVRKPRLSVARAPFAQAWRQLGETPPVAFRSASPCAGCGLHPVCSFCPGLEQSVERAGQDCSFYCQVARERARVLAWSETGPEEPQG